MPWIKDSTGKKVVIVPDFTLQSTGNPRTVRIIQPGYMDHEYTLPELYKDLKDYPEFDRQAALYSAISFLDGVVPPIRRHGSKAKAGEILFPDNYSREWNRPREGKKPKSLFARILERLGL